MSEEFDIIFAGGGTTACVIAGRLIAADPSLKILVIESGLHTHDEPRHFQPFRHVENLGPGSTTLSRYTAKPSEHLNGRSIVVSTGKGVGGGSTVNLMMYARGARSDYDDWAALGNDGWSFEELLPLIQKLETFTPIASRSETHGYSGPIQVSARGVDSGIKEQLFSVAREYDPDRPQVDDNNDFVTADAYSPAYQYTDSVTGRRSDTASKYLYPHAGNPNLTILVGKCVKRVIIDHRNGRAVGVEYTTDQKSPERESGEPVSVKANKLVVISAGAFGSPTILERSGIGSPSVLGKCGVDVLVDLPGVGENFQDHFGVPLLFYASDDTVTMNDVWRNEESAAPHLKEWETNGAGKLSYNGIEAFVKVRPNKAQLASAGSSLQQRWENFFEHNPDKSMLGMILFAGVLGARYMSTDRQLLSMCYYALYPESIGSVHIESGEDTNSPVHFVPNFVTEEGDLAELSLGYKMIRELFRRLSAYRGEVVELHPKFPPGSPAACKEVDSPVPIGAPDIVYSAADDEAIANFHRDKGVTTWHSIGTCAMKPRDKGGVIDPRLNVYGVQGLKVADLSICPTNVGNNTYSTALLIGEKAAFIIAEDLGI